MDEPKDNGAAEPEQRGAASLHDEPLPSLAASVPTGPPLPPAFHAVLRVLIYFAVGVAIYFLLDGISFYLQPRRLNSLWLRLWVESELVAAALLPAVFMSRIEKLPFDAYGLPRRETFGKQFWIGAVWGTGGLTLLMLAMRVAGVYYFGGLALHGTRILKFAAFYAVFFLLVGLFEEFAFRGYPQFTLSQGIGFWPSAVALSIVFGAIHHANQGESWIGALAAGLIGLFFCLTLWRTGNLWFAMGFHASWDWGETYLYSVPNSGLTSPGHLLKSSIQGSDWLSGGSVGPEGSVFVFVVIALLWVAFDRSYPQVRYPAREPKE
jgi:membrane protease YdiL (CAAX protease family)